MAIQGCSEKKTPTPIHLVTYKETDVKGPPDRSSSPARGLHPLVVFAASPLRRRLAAREAATLHLSSLSLSALSLSPRIFQIPNPTTTAFLLPAS
uniref:Uncharacterized protein n=1 Tax=Oryza punctata TaxID=4537 RepID=A0A0E0KW18_ORYPU